MKSICGINCDECRFNKDCIGCEETGGRPFGGNCIAAEMIKTGGKDAFEKFKGKIISEFNALGIDGMPEVTKMNYLGGFYVNLEYPIPDGKSIKLLDDKKIYLGIQIKRENGEKCFGLVADEKFLLVSEYGSNGSDPEIILYKKR